MNLVAAAAIAEAPSVLPSGLSAAACCSSAAGSFARRYGMTVISHDRLPAAGM